MKLLTIVALMCVSITTFAAGQFDAEFQARQQEFQQRQIIQNQEDMMRQQRNFQEEMRQQALENEIDYYRSQQ